MGPASDIDAAVTPEVLPRASGPLVSLILLGGAVMVGVGTVLTLVGYFLLTSGAITNYDHTFEYPLGGTTVENVKVCLGVVTAALVIGAVLVGCRSFRDTARSPRRRLAILIGIPLAFFFSGASGAAADHALSWASAHSSDAHASKAYVKAFMTRYRLAPLKMPSGFPAAPAAMAQRLVGVKDLGRGWYDDSTVNPAAPAVPPVMRAHGVVRHALSNIAEQHWTGSGWSLDHGLIESMFGFRTPTAAKRYAGLLARTSPNTCCAASKHAPVQVRTKLERVAGIPATVEVARVNAADEHRALFRRGSAVWSLTVVTLSGKQPISALNWNRIVRLAVERSTPVR